MDNRFNRDIYHYGSMREYKHREALKDADWSNDASLLEKIGSSIVFVSFIAIVLFLLLVMF
jgi:hypothetical protein